VIRECGLNPKDLVGALATINRDAELLEGSRHLAKILTRRSGYLQGPIQAALDALSMPDEALFLMLVGAIKS